ncbi:MAG: aminopeptidase [Planctomycetota bacterium]
MTNSDFETKLQKYADLLVVHGLNVQEGQDVQVTAETVHRDLVARVVTAAYERGARFVDVTLIDARMGRSRIENSREEFLEHVPDYVGEKYKGLVDNKAASLRITGSEDPDLFSDLDPKRMNKIRIAQRMAAQYFYEQGIGRSQVQWNVAAGATPGWGKKLFPELDPEAACAKLWDALFQVCRIDQPDPSALWHAHNERLHARGKMLTDLKIKELHFTGGGSDLIVELSEKAVFRGGSDEGARGVHFEPNIPTEEVFTTPDARKTRGHVKATRPFIVNGKLIEGLSLTFEDGFVKDFEATSGADTFREYIDSDPNARRLGEVALVGIDSPVYQSGIVFQEILLDENAACHIAVGSAYLSCLDGGETMSKEELADIGCNESTVHTDMMISSEEVHVDATTYSGDKIRLIENGQWKV